MMDYCIIRSRRKTVAIEITPRGEILIRCPVRMSRRDIQRFVESKSRWIETHLSSIHSCLPSEVLTPEEHSALIRSAKEYLPNRVRFWAGKLNVTYGRITIRSQHTRWGSCTASGNLNFNCLLMLAPEDIRDYVTVHELCHRKEMNHSPRFWEQVEAILPDYRTSRNWLKENGTALLQKFPKK